MKKDADAVLLAARRYAKAYVELEVAQRLERMEAERDEWAKDAGRAMKLAHDTRTAACDTLRIVLEWFDWWLNDTKQKRPWEFEIRQERNRIQSLLQALESEDPQELDVDRDWTHRRLIRLRADVAADPQDPAEREQS